MPHACWHFGESSMVDVREEGEKGGEGVIYAYNAKKKHVF
jgi:hypothetical protein